MLTSLELASMRTDSEAALPDTATITRPGAPGALNTTTGVMAADGAGTVIYTGDCQLRKPGSMESTVVFGEEQVTIVRYVALFPFAVISARIGDVITFGTSDNPDVTRLSYRITAVPVSTFTVFKGYLCEVVET